MNQRRIDPVGTPRMPRAGRDRIVGLVFAAVAGSVAYGLLLKVILGS